MRWVFQIYADGYTDKDEDGNQMPLDNLMINKQSKRLTVLKAMNGLDTTEPRLKMRQVLKECWEQAGLQPSELKEVLGYSSYYSSPFTVTRLSCFRNSQNATP